MDIWQKEIQAIEKELQEILWGSARHTFLRDRLRWLRFGLAVYGEKK